MIVLDTHTWVWWLSDPERLSQVARQAIDRAMGEKAIRVSAISAWEVALLVNKNRLRLTMSVEDWIAHSHGLPFLRFVDVDPRIAVRSVRLNGKLHPDPADRIIIATALILGTALVTRDEKIRAYDEVKTIW